MRDGPSEWLSAFRGKTIPPIHVSVLALKPVISVSRSSVIAVRCLPCEKVTVIVLCNNQAFAASGAANDLTAILFGAKYEMPVERKLAKVDPRIYDSYAGEYQLAPGFIMTVTREGDRLMTQATGQSKVEVFPESEVKFFLKVVEAQITFVKDENGRVTALILHQGGRDQTAKRIK